MFMDGFATAKDYLDHIMARALTSKVSDIHIENRGLEGIIRVRIEGAMREWARLPLDRMLLIVRRVKFIGGLDPEHSGRTGEGRFEFDHGGQKIVMRLSVLPTAGSDDLVIRILGSSPESFGLSELNFDDTIREGLKFCVNKSMGLILVTGPTGSGKTSTLYAAIQEINDGTLKIVTVEDPVEYKVTGLSQIKMDTRFNVTYANVLRGVLRHDPDVILIGECREIDAAEIAIEASMTGHLVLTTLHTNSAVSSILRLINMGVPAIDVSNSMTAAYAQRLIRKLCPKCKKPAKPSEDMIREMAKFQAQKIPKEIYIPAGCDACAETGYKGRLPVGELLIVDDDVRDVIIANPNLSALNKIAREKNMRTMLQHGLILVSDGELDYKDVIGAVS